MMSAVLSNPNHPEYGVATIPFPVPHDQYAYCIELLEALEIGDAVKACRHYDRNTLTLPRRLYGNTNQRSVLLPYCSFSAA